MTFETSLYQVATNFIGLKEKPGEEDNRFIQWCLSITSMPGPHHDEIPWCSAFLNGLCFILGLPRSGSAAARSWLAVGLPVDKSVAVIGQDIVVVSRGSNPTAGHVGIFAGYDGQKIKILGGNQGDMVSIASFPLSSVLGIRRILPKG
jgi:uncharacterized protein (TIGR02594 family)